MFRTEGNRVWWQRKMDWFLSGLDIVEVIRLMSFPLEENQRWKGNCSQAGEPLEYVMLCPLHEERSPSFTACRHKQFFHCFGCGVHGNVITFVMEWRHCGFVQAVEYICELTGNRSPFAPPKKRSGAELRKKRKERERREKRKERLAQIASEARAQRAREETQRQQVEQARSVAFEQGEDNCPPDDDPKKWECYAEWAEWAREDTYAEWP